MSEFRVEVVQLGKIGKHPNADTLSITQVCGKYPVILRTGQFQSGDKAVYVSVDALVPVNDPRFAFMQDQASSNTGYAKIRAKKIRGIFSMGLLVEADPSWDIGQDVRDILGIKKYENPLETRFNSGKSCFGPSTDVVPVYDLEGYRKYSHVLDDIGEVVLTEKIHGMNGRWVFAGDDFFAGSRQQWKYDGDNPWWYLARKHSLPEKLKLLPNLVVFGEVYGPCQDLKYGSPSEFKLAVFDILDLNERRYLNYDLCVEMAMQMDLPMVPQLYRGNWSSDLLLLANGKSTLDANTIREGFVVKPTTEQLHDKLGRVILKMVGEDYLLRKSA